MKVSCQREEQTPSGTSSDYTAFIGRKKLETMVIHDSRMPSCYLRQQTQRSSSYGGRGVANEFGFCCVESECLWDFEWLWSNPGKVTVLCFHSTLISTFLSNFPIIFNRGQQSKRCWLLAYSHSQLYADSYIIMVPTAHQPTFSMW